jgi:hypothetical protein
MSREFRYPKPGESFVPVVSEHVVDDPATAAAICFPGDPESQQMVIDASNRVKNAWPKRYVQVMERTHSFSRTLQLDPALPALDQIREAWAKVEEKFRGTSTADTMVCTVELWGRLKEYVPAESSSVISPGGLTHCCGMEVFTKPDAAAASKKARQLVLQGRRVLLVVE